MTVLLKSVVWKTVSTDMLIIWSNQWLLSVSSKCIKTLQSTNLTCTEKTFLPDTTVLIHSYNNDMAEVLWEQKKYQVSKKWCPWSIKSSGLHSCLVCIINYLWMRFVRGSSNFFPNLGSRGQRAPNCKNIIGINNDFYLLNND